MRDITPILTVTRMADSQSANSLHVIAGTGSAKEAADLLDIAGPSSVREFGLLEFARTQRPVFRNLASVGLDHSIKQYDTPAPQKFEGADCSICWSDFDEVASTDPLNDGECTSKVDLHDN